MMLKLITLNMSTEKKRAYQEVNYVVPHQLNGGDKNFKNTQFQGDFHALMIAGIEDAIGHGSACL